MKNRQEVMVEIVYLEKLIRVHQALSPVERRAQKVDNKSINRLKCRLHNLRQESACSRIPSITVIGRGDVRDTMSFSESVQHGFVKAN
jgi:hypothetical protein